MVDPILFAALDKLIEVALLDKLLNLVLELDTLFSVIAMVAVIEAELVWISSIWWGHRNL